MPFLEENIYVKVMNDIEEVSVGRFGSEQAYILDMDYDTNFKILEMVNFFKSITINFSSILFSNKGIK